MRPAPLARYATWAEAMRQPWIGALLARCRAMTAPDSRAEQHYRHPLALHETTGRPFEQARTELVYGEWLRRSRRRSDARGHLRAALQAFEALGSAPWAQRARTELGASVAAMPRAVTFDASAELTPQELQVPGSPRTACRIATSPRSCSSAPYRGLPPV